MAKTIPGVHGTTIISDTYCHGREVVVGPSEPRDKTDEEREAEKQALRIPFEDLGLTADELERAQALGFPMRAAFSQSWLGRPRNIYNKSQIRKFYENFAPIARKLLELESTLTK
jgi:hypothetical protein